MLQVLLPAFTLEKIDNGRANGPAGVNLVAEIHDTSKAIWLRWQRDAIQNSIRNFKERAAQIDRELTAFREDPRASSWRFSQPPFVFRYASGGTLPILRIQDREYYCLPYRDIHPIGWNLANGGSDSRDELLNPLTTIERELREEILIVDETKGIRYALQWDDEDALERPEFALAREFWKRRRNVDIGAFEERHAPVTWIHGPDAITVRCPRQPWRSTEGIFLNISAADFGIEVDRIARIHVEGGITVLDGETHGSKLVDRPIGLFEVNRFAKAFSRGEAAFIPDILFVSGDRVEGRVKIIARLNEALSARNRPLRRPNENEAWSKSRTRYVLCPVTRQLMARHLAQEEAVPQPTVCDEMPPARKGYKVFLSTTGHREDLDLARKIRRHLSEHRIGPVFFYKESYDSWTSMSWARKIEDALLSASILVVVCTNVARVRELNIEWLPFFSWLRYGRKKSGKIVPVVLRIDPLDLPIPLCALEAVAWPDTATLLKMLRARPGDDFAVMKRGRSGAARGARLKSSISRRPRRRSK